MKDRFSEKTTRRLSAISHFQFRAIFRRCDAYGGKKERKKEGGEGIEKVIDKRIGLIEY